MKFRTGFEKDNVLPKYKSEALSLEQPYS